MRTSKLLSLLMALLLSVGLMGSAFAEESTIVPADAVTEETVIYVQPATEPAQAPATDADPTQTPDGETPAPQPDVTQTPEATAETTDTPESTATPEATEQAEADPTATPETTDTPAPVQDAARNVSVHIQVPQNLQYGDIITLTATLTGFDQVNYAVRWQFTRDGQTWQDAEGAGSDTDTYRFAVSDQNVGTSWRLAVTTW